MDLRSKKAVAQSKKHSQHSNFMVIVMFHGTKCFNKRLQIPSDCKDLAFEYPWPFVLVAQLNNQEQLLSLTATLLDVVVFHVFSHPLKIIFVKHGNIFSKCIWVKMKQHELKNTTRDGVYLLCIRNHVCVL